MIWCVTRYLALNGRDRFAVCLTDVASVTGTPLWLAVAPTGTMLRLADAPPRTAVCPPLPRPRVLTPPQPRLPLVLITLYCSVECSHLITSKTHTQNKHHHLLFGCNSGFQFNAILSIRIPLLLWLSRTFLQQLHTIWRHSSSVVMVSKFSLIVGFGRFWEKKSRFRLGFGCFDECIVN